MRPSKDAKDGHGQKKSNHCPDCGQKYSFSYYQSEDISAVRSEGHSKADFVSTLRHDIGDHAIDSYSREAKRQSRESS
jgi:hypothetical protein